MTSSALISGRRSSSWAALFLLTCLPSSFASVSIHPHRVVIEGRTRSAEISLFNRGSTKATYRVLFEEMKMTEDGGLVRLEDDEEHAASAAGLIRYSPRQVVLEPGGAQAIRLLVRKPAGLAEGEYRSHLVVRKIPILEKDGIEAIQEPRATSARIIANPGMAIPVIVRHGQLESTATLEDVRIEVADDAHFPYTLSLRLNRWGSGTFYGDLLVGFRDGEELDVVAKRQAVAVYDGLTHRNLRIPLPPLPDHRGRQIVVELHARPETAGEDAMRPVATVETGLPAGGVQLAR